MSLRVLWEEQGGLCWYCRRRVRSKDGTVDHVLAKHRGGTNHKTNLVMACNRCNREKGHHQTHRTKTLGRLNALRAEAGLEPFSEADFVVDIPIELCERRPPRLTVRHLGKGAA